MTLAERLARYSYKPGWAFKIGEHKGRPAIVFRLRTVDARDPSKPLWLPGRRIITPEIECMEIPALTRVVRALVGATEAHETDEWFMYDGVKVNDPHGEAK